VRCVTKRRSRSKGVVSTVRAQMSKLTFWERHMGMGGKDRRERGKISRERKTDGGKEHKMRKDKWESHGTRWANQWMVIEG
jgi:hypothetical protein